MIFLVMNWIFGDNINTDLITPGRYNQTSDPNELSKVAFIEYLPEFSKEVKVGDFIIAGNNFGNGSSRETAAVALAHSGIEAVLAKSFARIFYRNSMNVGLMLVEVDTDGIDKNDRLELDLGNQKLVIYKKDSKDPTTRDIKVPDLMIKLKEQGGIIPFIKKHGLNFFNKLNI